jgi:hypothetical protein
LKKSCTDCAKLRTDQCKRPDHCVTQGYCDYSPVPLQPWKFCPECGSKLIREQSKRPTVGVAVTTLICPRCGKNGKEYREAVWEKALT